MMSKEHRCLKIGVDYHGVINNDIAYFRKFCKTAIMRGHEIHILSGGPEEKILNQLQSSEIEFTKVFTIFDFYNDKGLACQMPDGKFYIDENLWNETKAEYCRQNKIDIQIDDSLIYGKYFTTPYCLYNHQQKNCRLLPTNELIDLKTLTPLLSIEKIEEIFC